MLPRPRKRSPRQLSLSEREEILRVLLAGKSLREIGAELGRAPSTISREVRRNGSRSSYRVSRAEEAAACRTRRPKPLKLVQNVRLREQVKRRLAPRWSPEQISASLSREYPENPKMRVSHETIYRWPSQVSRKCTGARFGRTTRRSASTARSAGAPTSSASCRTARASCACRRGALRVQRRLGVARQARPLAARSHVAASARRETERRVIRPG
jgi:IS30 family transposase